MKLNEYIKAIEQCSDELLEGKWWRITRELGIYDNYPVLLKIDYDQLILDLNESTEHKGLFDGEYKLVKESVPYPNKGYRNNYFNYVPGTVNIQVGNWLFESGLIDDYPDLVHRKKQEQSYKVSMLIQDYQENKIPNAPHVRAIALVVVDIARYAQRKKVPLCFPNSMG